MVTRGMVEHMEMLGKAPKVIKYMDEPMITAKEIKDALRDLKNKKKSPGPDNIKPEIYKALGESNKTIEKIQQCFNELSPTGNLPDEWKESRTIMIPKIKPPKVNEVRPIALTNILYQVNHDSSSKEQN